MIAYGTFEQIYHKPPEYTAFTPYRICPLGAHSDHQLGKITGFAIDKGIHIAYGPKQNGIIEIQSMQFSKRAQWHVASTPKEKQDDWADHLRGATIALNARYPLRTGLCAVLDGELPIGGLSSSAAVIITFLSALCTMNGIHLNAQELVQISLEAENKYVGVSCGKLDQSCEVYCRKDQLLYMDMQDDSYELIPQHPNMKPYKIAIFFSGLERSLASSKFNIYTKFWRKRPMKCLILAAGYATRLAAQAGVRYSITNPDVYIEANIIGFYNILEACRNHPVGHLVYASSSSVYGSNKKIPYSTDDKVDNPVSLYAATKKSNELMAHAYSKLYNIPSTGLRFFTVYGPAGRPDMAYFGFTNKLRKGDTIEIFNFGNCKRDFTYVDDIVTGVKHVMQNAPEKVTGEDGLPIPPYRVYNIGNNSPENLFDFVDILQQELIRAKVLPEDYDFEAHKKLVPMQAGDVPITYADTSALERDFGFKPSTSLREGLRRFAEWYHKFYM